MLSGSAELFLEFVRDFDLSLVQDVDDILNVFALGCLSVLQGFLEVVDESSIALVFGFAHDDLLVTYTIHAFRGKSSG